MRKRSVPLPASPGMLPVAILAAGRKKVSGTFFRQYMLALVGFQGRGFDDGIQPDFCDPTPP